jgi:hypothetical protein
MALFDWLFGRSKSRANKSAAVSDRWSVSENGNPTLIEGSTRITVFQQDRGWKFCIAAVNDREEPFFSEAYASEQEAREEALANLRGEPSRYQPLSVSFAEDRRQRWETHIRERSKVIEELQRYLAENADLGITALRKPEAKIASHLKQIDWQIAEYQRAGVSTDLISLAERQRPALATLAQEVAARIKAKQVQRPSQKAFVSDSQLSDDLASKVDDLIRLFADSRVMEHDERERLYRESTRAATTKMLDEGLTYGQASGAPEFLNQDEESFRAFMKKADQDLQWQCETVTAAFKRYRQTGEIPAPHYPMRVAVLLHKAKDFDREKQFLAAWCRHFPTGNGAAYAALVERATKTGAIPA